MPANEVRAYVEVGTRRVFACAVDWPGWARAGKTEEAAVEALAAYAPRYAVVAAAAGRRVPADPAVVVVGTVKGDATTDFGAPGAVGPTDHEPVTAREAKQAAALLTAAWDELARVAAAAPAELRKGPRGGGRDTAKIVAHVAEAEAAYARMVGVKRKVATPEDLAALRDELVAVLGAPWTGEPLGKWPPRYAARRIAWHVLDHLWEIEDRSS